MTKTTMTSRSLSLQRQIRASLLTPQLIFGNSDTASYCLGPLVTSAYFEKNANSSEIPYVAVGPKNHVLDGCRSPTAGAILRGNGQWKWRNVKYRANQSWTSKFTSMNHWSNNNLCHRPILGRAGNCHNSSSWLRQCFA